MVMKRRVSKRDLKVLRNLRKKGSVTDIDETYNYPDTFEIINKLYKMKFLNVDRGYRDPHYKISENGKDYLRKLKRRK
jgi:hypothetical protein